MVLVGVLGPAVLHDAAGAEVPVPGMRQRRLLAALALHAGTPVGRDALVDLVWGADPPADPVASLQTQITRLRRLLPAGVTVKTGPGSYRLDVPAGDAADAATPVATPLPDVNATDAALDAAVFAATPVTAALPDVDAALALWRGTPYADLDDVAVRPQVGRLLAHRADLRERRATLLLDAGRAGDAAAEMQGQLADEPLRESAAALLMRAHAAAGHPAGALAAFARLRRTLAEELGTDPGPELVALHEVVLRGARPVPALPVSSFVGRRADLERVVAAVRAHRVVTLVGPGGVGKTRLARHAAAALAPDLDDGVLSVELEGVGPDGLAGAVAAVVRLTDAAVERIVDLLAVRKALLVLDDADHVLDALAPMVEAIAAGAPAVTVLVTSREALRADGEQVLPVGPLAPADAARLLADRVRAAAPGAALDPGRVASVCDRLDGLPLALELAAARAAVVGLDGLALDDPLDGLGPGRRAAGIRHRSLRDVVDWSARLLDADQRALFVRAGVFAGSVEPAEMAAVCGDARVLPDLVARSLLLRDASGTVGMLDTVRAYAREHLAADPGAAALRRRHAAWAAGIAADAARARGRADEAVALRRLDTHLQEVLRAAAWLARNGPLDQLLQIGLVAAELGYQRSQAELVALADDALRAVGCDPDAGPDAAADGGGGVARHPVVPRLLGLTAVPLWLRGDADGARRRAERALALAAALGEPALGRDAHEALSNIALFRGELEVGRSHAARAAELAAEAGDDTILLMALVDEAVIAAYSGDDPAAARHEAAAGQLAARMGSPLARGWAAYAAGERRAEAGDPAAAAHLERAVALAAEVGGVLLAGVARHTLLTRATRPDGTGLAPLLDTWHAMGSWPQLWIAVRALTETLSAQRRHADAARLLGALRVSPRAGRPSGADAARLATVEQACSDALGPALDVHLAHGAAMGDTAALALARRLAR